MRDDPGRAPSWRQGWRGALTALLLSPLPCAQSQEVAGPGVEELLRDALRARTEEKDPLLALSLYREALDRGLLAEQDPDVYVDIAETAALAELPEEVLEFLELALSCGWVNDEADLRRAPLWALRNQPWWSGFVERAQLGREAFLLALDPRSAGLEANLALERFLRDAADASVPASRLLDELSGWNVYPAPTKTGVWLRYTALLPDGSAAPYFVRIPRDYDPGQRTPLVVYSAGGWYGRPDFHPAQQREFQREDPIAGPAGDAGMIVLFSAGCQRVQTQQKEGLDNVRRQVAAQKRVLNIDDDRVHFMGFSDGGTGVYRAAALDPTPYAAFFAINGWFQRESPLANMSARPTWSWASEKDSLYPLDQVRAFFERGRELGADWRMTIVPGEDHFYAPFVGRYLPEIVSTMLATRRNVCPAELRWECAPDSPFRSRDWLEMDAGAPAGAELPEGANSVVEAGFHENLFTLRCRALRRITLRLHARMIDFARPVVVIVDGVERFNARVTPDKASMLAAFEADSDRSALWCGRIEIELPRCLGSVVDACWTVQSLPRSPRPGARGEFPATFTNAEPPRGILGRAQRPR